MVKKEYRKKVFKKEKKEYEEELLQLARVTRVVKGGRRLRFRATVAIGNRKGKVGIGTGKSAEVAVAVQKAVAVAKKSLINVPLTANASIPHEVKVKFKAAKLLVMPCVEGTGVKAGGVVRKIFDLAGIHNILAKRYGSTTPLVNAQATIIALQKLIAPKNNKSTPNNVEENTNTEEEIIVEETEIDEVEE